jgi:hypothetical protein
MPARLANLQYDRDPKTGRVRIVRSWHVDTEDEIEAAPDAFVMGYGFTGELKAANWDPQDISQGFQVDAVYEGVALGYKQGIDKARWSFRPAFEKEPIEKLPQIGYLIQNYGGQEDPETHRVVFRRTLPRSGGQAAGSTSNAGLLQNGGQGAAGDEVPNPLYGLNESGWLSMSGYAVAKFITDDPSQLEGVGEIVDTLPGNAPDFGVGEDRNWLKAPPVIDEIPQAEDDGERLFDVELHLLLSPKGGWPPAVYRFIDV